MVAFVIMIASVIMVAIVIMVAVAVMVILSKKRTEFYSLGTEPEAISGNFLFSSLTKLGGVCLSY